MEQKISPTWKGISSFKHPLSRSILIFHGSILGCEVLSSPFNPHAQLCRKGVLPRFDQCGWPFKVAGWFYCIKSMKMYEQFFKFTPEKWLKKNRSSPLKILDLSSSLLIISCHCRHGGVHVFGSLLPMALSELKIGHPAPKLSRQIRCSWWLFHPPKYIPHEV